MSVEPALVVSGSTIQVPGASGPHVCDEKSATNAR